MNYLQDKTQFRVMLIAKKMSTHLKAPDEVRPSVLVPSLSCCRGSSHAVHPRKRLYAQYANFSLVNSGDGDKPRILFREAALRVIEDERDNISVDRNRGTIGSKNRDMQEASDSARSFIFRVQS